MHRDCLERLVMNGHTHESDRDQLRLRLEAAVRGAVRVDANRLTVAELVAVFIEHGTADFAARRGTTEAGNYRDATRELLSLYPDLPARDFDVLHLKAVRLLMIERGLCRETINRQRIRRIRTIFRWAVEQHGLDGAVLARIMAVRPLRPGVAGVTESRKAPLPSLDDVAAVLSDRKCPAVNRAMLRFQLLTAARPGEVCQADGRDFDQTRSPWIWEPGQHKNLWRGKPRIIPVGPAAQLALLPYMRHGLMFLTKRGRPFRVDHYHQMVTESCERVKVQRFAPQSMRRLALTLADEHGGIETAMELAGHADVRTTEIYLRRAGVRAAKYAQDRG